MTVFFRCTAAAAVALSAAASAASADLRFEAEDGRLSKAVASDGRATEGGGPATPADAFSGSGYVTNFVDDEATVTLTFPAEAGVYGVRIGYRSPQGPKGYTLSVNGLKAGGEFAGTGDAFEVEQAGRVELVNGENTVVIDRGWGFFDVDWIAFEPFGAITPPPAIDPTPVNPDATPEARALLARLASVYGRGTLSGVYSLEDAEHVYRVTGERPALYAQDLMDFTPGRIARGAEPGDVVGRQLEAAKGGAVIGLSWHWNAPSSLIDDPEHVDENGKTQNAAWYKGFYTYATTFDVEAAMDDPASREYAELVSDIDVIAGTLRAYADAGVPVLWRPLHEANGRWFWWSAKGPGPYVKLWRLMYDRLVNHHGLHNLVWVYNGDLASYPGDDVVDLVGVDAYRDDLRDPLTGDWQVLQDRLAGEKMIALTEFGKVPDVPRMHRLGAWYLFFVSWTGDSSPSEMPGAELRRIYTDPGVINLDDWRDVEAPEPRTAGENIRKR